MAQHSHSFFGNTSWNSGHMHHYGGVTARAESGVPHIHNMRGITTYYLDHEHPYVTRTGPAIFLKNGRHIHYFRTRVELADGHTHNIYGYTSAD